MAAIRQVHAQDVPQSEPDDNGKVAAPEAPRQLLLGLGFGIVFGFLLQKGGVGKYEVLMGQFLLTDFTVIKIMLTAIVVGMVGIFWLRSRGLVKLHVKPTHMAANIVGGLLFGVGLGLLGYCPGTGAAALGQGNYDALAGVAGLIAGSYVFAQTSGRVSATIQKIGSLGKVTLPDLLGWRRPTFLAVFVPVLVLGLVLLGWAP